MLSAPSEHVAHPQVSAPEAAPEHRGLLKVEEVHEGGCGWGSIEPTRLVVLSTARDEGPALVERGYDGVLPVGHHSTMVLCALVVPASSTSIPFAELLPPFFPLRKSPHGQLQSSAWVCSPSPRSSTQPLSAVKDTLEVDTLSGLVGRARISTPSAALTVLLPHTGCHVLFHRE